MHFQLEIFSKISSCTSATMCYNSLPNFIKLPLKSSSLMIRLMRYPKQCSIDSSMPWPPSSCSTLFRLHDAVSLFPTLSNINQPNLSSISYFLRTSSTTGIPSTPLCSPCMFLILNIAISTLCSLFLQCPIIARMASFFGEVQRSKERWILDWALHRLSLTMLLVLWKHFMMSARNVVSPDFCNLLTAGGFKYSTKFLNAWLATTE